MSQYSSNQGPPEEVAQALIFQVIAQLFGQQGPQAGTILVQTTPTGTTYVDYHDVFRQRFTIGARYWRQAGHADIVIDPNWFVEEPVGSEHWRVVEPGAIGEILKAFIAVYGHLNR